MPFIQVRSNKEITREKEERIKMRLGEAISLVEKTESWLMVEVVSNLHMYFKGQSEPCCFIDVKLYGGSSRENYDRFTETVTKIVNEEIEISPNNIYVCYGAYQDWGWNGHNF